MDELLSFLFVGFSDYFSELYIVRTGMTLNSPLMPKGYVLSKIDYEVRSSHASGSVKVYDVML